MCYVGCVDLVCARVKYGVKLKAEFGGHHTIIWKKSQLERNKDSACGVFYENLEKKDLSMAVGFFLEKMKLGAWASK